MGFFWRVIPRRTCTRIRRGCRRDIHKAVAANSFSNFGVISLLLGSGEIIPRCRICCVGMEPLGDVQPALLALKIDHVVVVELDFFPIRYWRSACLCRLLPQAEQVDTFCRSGGCVHCIDNEYAVVQQYIY